MSHTTCHLSDPPMRSATLIGYLAGFHYWSVAGSWQISHEFIRLSVCIAQLVFRDLISSIHGKFCDFVYRPNPAIATSYFIFFAFYFIKSLVRSVDRFLKRCASSMAIAMLVGAIGSQLEPSFCPCLSADSNGSGVSSCRYMVLIYSLNFLSRRSLLVSEEGLKQTLVPCVRSKKFRRAVDFPAYIGPLMSLIELASSGLVISYPLSCSGVFFAAYFSLIEDGGCGTYLVGCKCFFTASSYAIN